MTRIAVLIIIMGLFVKGLTMTAQVERNDPHKMWLLKTTQAPATEAPSVYYYKFQAGKLMKCVAVFKVKVEKEYCVGECAYSPAVALTSQEVPCE